MAFLRAAATVGGFTGLSRLAGFVRDVLIAAALGAGPAADAFFVSFKLANFLRRLFVEGAFNAAFVPRFSRILHEAGRHPARHFAEAALAFMATFTLVLLLLAELLMPWLVRLIATGFAPGGERYALAVELSRITFPYLVLISLAAVISGMLNGLGRFAAPAFAPVLLNVCLIGALLLAQALGSSAVHGLAWGVAGAGLVQLLWVAADAARAGYALRPVRPRLSPDIRALLRLLLPGAAGAGVMQLNLLVNSWFASYLATGSIAYLFYADRLVQLPLGLVGVALGTAVLPLLSRETARSPDYANEVVNRALELGLLLSLPAALGLALLAGPIVEVLFERGAFDRQASEATAAALAAMAFGLPAQVVVRVLAPAFFAREDTGTPMRIAALALLVNPILILVLIGPLAHAGIALATTLSGVLNAGLLTAVLCRRSWLRPDHDLRRRLPRILAGSAAMVGVLLTLPRRLPASAPSSS